MFIVLFGAGGGCFVRDRATQKAELVRQTRESLSRFRTLIAGKKLAMARQELAEPKGRRGDDRTWLAKLAQEMEAVEDELRAVDANRARFERYLELVDQAHEAEFSSEDDFLVTGDRPGFLAVQPLPLAFFSASFCSWFVGWFHHFRSRFNRFPFPVFAARPGTARRRRLWRTDKVGWERAYHEGATKAWQVVRHPRLRQR